MIVFLLVIIGLLFYKSKIYLMDFNVDYLSREQTDSVKGIFILLVFYRHITQYVEFNQWFDYPMTWINEHMFQLLVAMFLFYSGYGVACSIQKKGYDYVRAIPRRRFLVTLINFDLAVFCYLLIDWIFKIEYPRDVIIQSFIGWESVGNSNWYIFVILCLYLLVYISFRFLYKHPIFAILIFSVLSVGLIYILQLYKEYYFYDTILCFTFGVVYAHAKELIEEILSYNFIWMVLLIIGCCLIKVIYPYAIENIVLDEVWALVFCMVVLLITMKIHIKNKVLIWLGKNLFGLYIMQRFPMILFDKLGLSTYNNYLYFGVCFIFTILVGGGFNKVVGLIDKGIR